MCCFLELRFRSNWQWGITGQWDNFVHFPLQGWCVCVCVWIGQNFVVQLSYIFNQKSYIKLWGNWWDLSCIWSPVLYLISFAVELHRQQYGKQMLARTANRWKQGNFKCMCPILSHSTSVPAIGTIALVDASVLLLSNRCLPFATSSRIVEVYVASSQILDDVA